VKRRLTSAYLYLRKNGFRSFCVTVFDYLHLRGRIFLRGRNRTVTLDGCHFPLQEFPDNSMKLALLDGSYESIERTAVRKYLQPSYSVVEFGGCVGVVSCIANKILSNPRAHVVIEMNPLAIPYLERNRDQNQCAFRIVNGALAYGTNEISFRAHAEFWGNFLNQGGNWPEVTIPAMQLKQILEEEEFEGYALICDIEGQEYELFMHEPEVVSKAGLIIMELHPAMTGQEKVQELLSSLKDWGFQLLDKSADVVVFGKNHPQVVFTAS
jgi:FkbM family methyltransferase